MSVESEYKIEITMKAIIPGEGVVQVLNLEQGFDDVQSQAQVQMGCTQAVMGVFQQYAEATGVSFEVKGNKPENRQVINER